MKTGKLIKELRTKKGITQEELAELTELSSRTIQRIENDEVDPRAYTLQMISKALDVDYRIFLEQETDQEQEQETQKTINSNWLGLLHLSGILPLIIPTVLVWNFKKGKINDITKHYRIVIRFQLMILGVALASLWVYWKINMLTPFFGVLLMNGLFSIMNTIRVMNGDSYKYMFPMESKTKTDKITNSN